MLNPNRNKMSGIGAKVCILAAITAMTLSACGRTDGDAGGISAKLPEPVTVKVRFIQAYNDLFQRYVEPVVKQKYPYISLEYMDTKTSLDDLIASGGLPDLMIVQADLRPMLDLKIQYDLTELAKKNNFNLDSIDQTLLRNIREYGAKGELYALPADRSSVVMLYNKDIFDKFAVPYPADGITWDETLALAKRVTRVDGDTQYFGLHPNTVRFMKSELSLPYFDKAGKASLMTPEWQRIASFWKSIYEIPGNQVSGVPQDLFSKNKNVAMILSNATFLLRSPDPALRWGLVTAPTFENKQIPDQLGSMFAMTSASKNKDTAFLLLSLYYSDEVQTAIARDAGIITVLNKPDIQKQFGANVKDSQNYNLDVQFKGKPAVKIVEQYENIASGIVNKAFSDIAAGAKDINSALRNAEEEINQKVKEKMSQ